MGVRHVLVGSWGSGLAAVSPHTAPERKGCNGKCSMRPHRSWYDPMLVALHRPGVHTASITAPVRYLITTNRPVMLKGAVT